MDVAPVSTTLQNAAQKRPGRADKADSKKTLNKRPDRRNQSKGRDASNVKIDSQPSEPVTVQVVPPKLKHEDMQRHKEREQCFRSGQVRHWSRKSIIAAVCRNCGMPNATVKTCTKCNAKVGNE